MWIGNFMEGEAERREDTTEPPCLPVAPMTRYFLVAISADILVKGYV